MEIQKTETSSSTEADLVRATEGERCVPGAAAMNDEWLKTLRPGELVDLSKAASLLVIARNSVAVNVNQPEPLCRTCGTRLYTGNHDRSKHTETVLNNHK